MNYYLLQLQKGRLVAFIGLVSVCILLNNTAAQTSTIIAGMVIQSGNTGDGGPATLAKIGDPAGIAFDNIGNLYIADHSYHVIRKVNTAGIISTIAGTGAVGYSGDGGQAILAKLNGPTGLALDKVNNLLYVADETNNVIRRINLTTGIIST
jgi:DNA-binding beta-propeller fold protein YncE